MPWELKIWSFYRSGRFTNSRLFRNFAEKIQRLESTLAMFADEIVKDHPAVRPDSLNSKRTFFAVDPGHYLRPKGDQHFRPCPNTFGSGFFRRFLFLKNRHLYFQILPCFCVSPFAAKDGSFLPAYHGQIFATAVQSAFELNRRPDASRLFSFYRTFVG